MNLPSSFPLRLSWFLAALLSLSQCKSNDAAPSPIDQLPPATQTGGGTFGCLINGQPWTPINFLVTNTFSVTYDPSYVGGALQVKTKRFIGPKYDLLQALTFGAASVTKVGVYQFPLNGLNGIFYSDAQQPTPCSDYGNPRITTYQAGTLTITRFDLAQGIISGTFSFTLVQPGCDTLKVTQGRFDKKL
jgi:hypothetical protein